MFKGLKVMRLTRSRLTGVTDKTEWCDRKTEKEKINLFNH